MTGPTGATWRAVALWLGLTAALLIPVIAATQSPLLAWRQPIYIAAGLCGIVGFVLMLVQPLLATGALPGLSPFFSRQIHRWIGAMLVALIIAHVAGLWITSPPDVVDALLFTSPTPFSAWGVIAMWAAFAAAGLAALRRRLSIPLRRWRAVHLSLALVITSGTAVHALLIEGTMEPITKTLLCLLVMAVTVTAVLTRWRPSKPANRHH